MKIFYYKNSKSDCKLIFVLSFILVFLKFFFSYLHYPNDFIITKILIEIEDVEYFPLVKSLSELNLFISFNKDLVAKNLITFPTLSIFWHSLFYKFFGIFSFIFLEFLFKFLTIYVFYNIFREFNFMQNSAILFAFFLTLLPSFFGILDLPKTISDESHLYFKYLQIIYEQLRLNLGWRFPRPLVTHFYLFLFILLLIILNKKVNQKNKLLVYLSIVLLLLANSFFYFFITCVLTIFFLFISNYKKYIFYITNNFKNLIIFFIIIFIGIAIIILQNIYGEIDHASRIGVYKIDYNKKIFLLKYFINNCILRIEILILILTNIFISYFIKFFIKIKAYNSNLKIFSYFVLASILSPFFFVIISHKVILLYQFFDFIIFILFFYNIFCACLIFNYYFSLKIKNFYFTYTFLGFFFIFYSHNYYYTIGKFNPERENLNFVANFLKKNNLYGSKKVLFSNNHKILNLWIHNDNKYLLIPPSFSNSLKDEQIEDHLLHFLSYLKFPESKLISLFEKNIDSIYFPWNLLNSYKYEANSFKTYSSINQYKIDQQEKIKNTSPLRATSHFVPQDELKRLLQKYKLINKMRSQYNITYPDYIIVDLYLSKYLNTQSIYKEVSRNFNYVIFEKLVAKKNY